MSFAQSSDDPAGVIAATEELILRLEKGRRSQRQAASAELRAFLEEGAAHVADRAAVAAAVRSAATALAASLAGEPERLDERIVLLEQAYTAAAVHGRWDDAAVTIEGLLPLLVATGKLERTRELLEECLPNLRSDDWRRPLFLSQLAEFANHALQWDGSLAYLEEAERALDGLAAVNEPMANAYRAQVFGLRSDVTLRMGLIDQGVHWNERERAVLDSLPDVEELEPLRVKAHVRRANVRLAADRWQSLVDEVGTVLDTLDGATYPVMHAALSVRLGVALAALEELDETRERRAESIFREVLDRDVLVPPNERRQAMTRLVHLCLRDSRVDEATDLLETLRAEAAREASSVGEIVSPLDDAYLAALEARVSLMREDPREQLVERHQDLAGSWRKLLDHWLSVPARHGGLGFLEYDTVRYVLCELIALTLAVEPEPVRERRALEVLLEAQGLGTLARRLGAPQATVEMIRSQLLNEGEGMLFYMGSSYESHLFIVDAERLSHQVLPPDRRFERDRRELVRVVTRSPRGMSTAERLTRRDVLRRLGRSLAEWLLPESVETIVAGWHSVTIVGAELLGYLPFECLVLRDGALLGLEKPVGYLPSIPLGLAVAARSAPDEEAPHLCVFVASPDPTGDPDAVGAGLPALPLGESAAAKLTGAYDDTEAVLLTGGRATIDNITDPENAASSVLHFLVHGVHDYERERTAGLLLQAGEEGSGSVWMDRLETLDAPPLVLLTACGSLRGPARFGDPGVTHLGGTMLIAGARTVILPYADIAYEPTLELSADVHRALRSGASPAEAMWLARRALAAKDRFSDPYYHGLLHVYGLPHVPVFEAAESRVSKVPWLVGAGAALASFLGVGIAAQARRRGRRHREHESAA